ncbi:MAG: hypothetical protein VYE68_12275 [Acidobacteriota bacterium]|nr:hypothetical protein [Acidobacteriota bacterium]
MWHVVGRGCFHLAENTPDPEYPFAFMAPALASVGEGRHRGIVTGIVSGDVAEVA